MLTRLQGRMRLSIVSTTLSPHKAPSAATCLTQIPAFMLTTDLGQRTRVKQWPSPGTVALSTAGMVFAGKLLDVAAQSTGTNLCMQTFLHAPGHELIFTRQNIHSNCIA